MAQGQYTSADVDQPAAATAGQYSAADVDQPSPAKQPLVFAHQAQPEQGFWNRAGQFYAGVVDPFINAVQHPIDTALGFMTGGAQPGVTPGLGMYPGTSATGFSPQAQARDIASEQTKQQLAQQTLEQNRRMLTEHPAYAAGNLVAPFLAAGALKGAIEVPGAVRDVGDWWSRTKGIPGPYGEGVYSPEGAKVAASLKPVGQANIDVPAVSNRTLPLLKESYADLSALEGVSKDSFSRIEGPLTFKNVTRNAVDIAEQRARAVLDPITSGGQLADPRMLANSPELVEYIGKDPGQITNLDVDQARMESNKLRARSNYDMKPLSKQIGAAPNVVDAVKVGNQARTLLYDTAADSLGIDRAKFQEMRQREADLITLSDLANSTHNWLSGKEATYQAAGLPSKLAGAAKGVLAAKTGPLSALSVAEQPGLLPPTNKFNANMRDVFGDVRPQVADVHVNLRGQPWGVTYPEWRGRLPENVPGYASSVPGGQPFAPPGYQLGPAPPQTFPQTTIQGTPYPRPPLQLPGGQAPVYVEPQTTPLNRMLPRKGVPATRR